MGADTPRGSAGNQPEGAALPNFFIVGAPKAGTTFLYQGIEAHPQVFMPACKETNYFTHEELGAHGIYYEIPPVSTWNDYRALFSSAGDAIAVGEASVSYLFYGHTAERIHGRLPDSRILIMLRDPIDRAFSHYLMDCRLGHVRRSLNELVYKETLPSGGELFYQQYVEIGLYYEQVKRYFDVFGRSRVKIVFFEELDESDALFTDVFRFLDIDPTFAPPLGGRVNAHIGARSPLIAKLYAMPRLRRAARLITGQSLSAALKRGLFRPEPKPVLGSAVRAHLQAIYHDDVARLQDLIGRDLGAWCRTDLCL